MASAVGKPPGPTMQPPQKATAPARQRDPGAKNGGRLSPLLRGVISVFIVWHLLAIFLAALCVPTTSPLVLNIAQRPPMQWYLDALYLNQGHAFFAPDVGPSHVIYYELYDQSGQRMEDGELPSRKEHWPRLRYHRHFMLADQVPIGDDGFTKFWQREYLQAFARHLLRTSEKAQAVRVRHYAHWPLHHDLELQARAAGRDGAYRILMERLAERGIRVDDQGYQLLMEVTQRRSDLPQEEPEPTIQSNQWQSGPIETAGRWTGAPR